MNNVFFAMESEEMLRTVVFVAVALVLLGLLAYCATHKKASDWRLSDKRIALGIYLLFLLSMLIPIPHPAFSDGRVLDAFLNQTGYHDPSALSNLTFMADLLLFVPLGYFIRFLHHRSHWVRMSVELVVIVAAFEVLRPVMIHSIISPASLVAHLVGAVLGIFLRKWHKNQFALVKAKELKKSEKTNQSSKKKKHSSHHSSRHSSGHSSHRSHRSHHSSSGHSSHHSHESSGHDGQ